MATLNDYITDDGTNLGIQNQPTDRYSPNGIARITPKYSRGDASEAYDTWVMDGIGHCEVTNFTSILDGSASWTGGTYMLFTDGATDGYIWFKYNGAGADQAPNGNNLGQVNVFTGSSKFDIITQLERIFRGLASTEILMVGSHSINVRNTVRAVTTDATAGTLTGSVITVSVEVQGAAPDATPWDGTYTDIDGAQDLAYTGE